MFFLTIKRIKNKLNSGLLNKIFFLIIHFGAAQCVLVLASPLLTRLYTPEMFAYFGYVISLATVILPLASLQYEYAILLTKLKRVTHLLLRLCVKLVVVIASILLCVSLIVRLCCSAININSEIVIIGFFILLLQGVLQVYTIFLISSGKTASVAHGKLIQNIIMVAVQISLPLIFVHSATALLFGLVVGLFCNFIYFRFCMDAISCRSRVQFTKRRLFFLLKRYYKLPLFSSGAVFIETASTLMPVFLIGPIYGANALGVYFLVYRVFIAPVGLLNMAVSKVMLKELSDRVKNKVNIMPLFINTSIVLACIAIFYLMIMLYMSTYVSLIFGDEWRVAKPVLKILAPSIAITLCVSPLSAIFMLLNRNAVDFVWQLFYIIFTVGIIYVFRHGLFINMLTYLIMAWVFLYSIYWVLMYGVISTRDKQGRVVNQMESS